MRNKPGIGGEAPFARDLPHDQLPMKLPLVATNSLTKRYGDFTALRDCSLRVERGEVFGLLGPNGSGKTTLLRLLMGFLKPTSGAATIDGLDCHAESVAVHRIAAYLPGDVRLFRAMRGRAVLKFFCGMRSAGAFERALGLAERLELDLSRRVAAFSTGMRQKLALAATLSADTPLIVLDEPTSNLDPTVRSQVAALVREARQAGRTVIFSSHVLEEVEAVCDRVVILKRGLVVCEQNLHALLRQHRIRARLTGPLAAPPPSLASQLEIETHTDSVTITTPGELSPLLAWLARLPLAEVRIEPVGLRALYHRYHATEAA